MKLHREEILAYMRESTYKPLTAQELVEELEIENISEFLAVLRDLEREGQVIVTRKQKYGIPEKMGLRVGRVQAHAKGYAFLIPDDGKEDIYLSAENLNGAMHNDRVIVRPYKKDDLTRRAEGEVIRILSRANQQVVGTFERTGRFGFVIPDDPRIFQDIFIPTNEAGQARHGQKVVAEITSWPEKRRNPQGRVVEVLGRLGEPGVDILSVVRKYRLPEEFPPEVLREAERVAKPVEPEDLHQRVDLRQVKMVTIDGADAKDLDDAVSIEQLANGNYRLGVHIADVGHYVREGSLLDNEALRRGTSVYLVDRVIPMLPTQLSNGICSLNAGQDRLAMSVLMELDAKGNLQKYEIVPSVINVDQRMTYDAVRKILVDKDQELIRQYSDFVKDFRLMEKLCLALRTRRMQRGAIDFNFPESKVLLDENGRPIEIVRLERSIAEQIIEEFMILANEVVAQHMYWLEAPFVYRVHEQPDALDLEQLNNFLHTLGYHIRSREDEIQPKSFQEIVEKVAGRPEEKVVNTVMLRSMKHARYAPACLGHFGLASQYYCHFTSPIRRYPDLAIHRIIKETLLGGGLSQNRRKQLEEKTPLWAEQSSLRELTAEEAERESVDLKKVEFMERHLGEVFAGIISSVTPFGLFVELENTVEGLVHVSSMTDDYYHFDEERLLLMGQHTRKVYKIGGKVTVQVVRADVSARQVDLEIVLQ